MKNLLVAFLLLLRLMDYNFFPLIWIFIWKIFFLAIYASDTLRNTTHYIWTFQKSTFQQFIDSQSTVVLYALNHQCRVQFLLLYSEQNLCFRQMKFQHRYQQSTFLFNLIYWNNFSHNVTQKITCPVRQVLAIFTCPWNFFHWFRTSINVEPGKQIDARH